jgi:hypothetical protein
VTAAADGIPALRRAPGRLGDAAIAPGLLKHADEQSVVGVVAVLRAVAAGGLDPAGFGDWGVVAAPGFLGRAAFNDAFPRFLADGAWGVGPLLTASHSLHSVSGMVSQALNAHGPNLGAGGAPSEDEQALLAAAVLLDEGAAPGVWVVLTDWTPGPDGDQSPAAYEALAVALTAPRPGWTGPRLRVEPGDVRVEPATDLARWRVDGGHWRQAPHLSRLTRGRAERKAETSDGR